MEIPPQVDGYSKKSFIKNERRSRAPSLPQVLLPVPLASNPLRLLLSVNSTYIPRPLRGPLPPINRDMHLRRSSMPEIDSRCSIEVVG